MARVKPNRNSGERGLITQQADQNLRAVLEHGIAMHRAGHLKAAEDSYSRWLKSNPGEVTATFGMAELRRQQGRLADAAKLLRQVVRSDPSHVDAWSNLATTCLALRDFNSALECLRKIVDLRPASSAAHANLAGALLAARRPADAIDSYQRAILLRPDDERLHNQRGIALAALSRFDEALDSFERALSLKPDWAEAHNNQAGVLTGLGRLEDAMSGYRRAVTIDPQYAVAYLGLGRVMQMLKGPADALACFERAIELQPDLVRAHHDRGVALARLDRPEQALGCFDRVIALAPDDAEAHNNRGCALAALSRIDEALTSYHRALRHDPELADARWNIGFEELRQGRLPDAWPRYEYRWKRTGAPPRRHESTPQWDGIAPLSGKRLLTWSEQGFGDTLQFCRYVPMLAALGAQVVLEVQTELVPLIKSLAGVAELHGDREEFEPCDLQVPLLSLPAAFRTDLRSIPADVPYVAVDRHRVVLWRNRVEAATGGQVRIGIACSGNPRQLNDRNRSMPFREFAPLYGRAQLYLLQKEVRCEDEAALRDSPVKDLRADLNDFADTAALVECLDRVISVDTSVAHLAGALGRPLWVMLSRRCDWRWLEDRTDSPWYPGARLFRQRSLGDWAGVVDRVAAELDALARPATGAAP